MLRQKIEISKNNIDANVNIYFQSSNNLGGLSQDIDNLVTDQTGQSINDTNDGEKLRFLPQANYTLVANFYNHTSNTYVINVAPSEFSGASVVTAAFQTSFYAYKIFDSVNENTQNLLYSGYLNGFNFNGITSSYAWNKNFEFGDIHIPYWYVNSVTGNTFDLYMRLHFYSAKSGKVYPFSGVTSFHTEADIYNKITFTISTKMYSVTTPFTFKEITNSTYVSLINDSVDSLGIQKPVVPTGTTFTNTGTYVTL